MREHWTDEELSYLQEKWGVLNPERISKKIGRTQMAIAAKACKLGLGGQIENAEDISFNTVIKELGYEGGYTWIIKKFQKYGCPFRSKKLVNKRVRMVNMDEFWKWAEQHQNIMNFTKFEENSLGLEPEWVKKKRKRDLNSLEMLNRNRPWSKEDDNLLISKLKKQKYTYEDLSDYFKRTESAIKRRIYELGTPYRPLPRNYKVRWTEDEDVMLYELYKNNYSPSYIAKKLNKSMLVITERVKLLDEVGRRESKINYWTKTEIEYLKKYWKEKNVCELAKEIHRTNAAITKKASELGLSRKRKMGNANNRDSREPGEV